jgi:DNA polymerase elongation subunit (family B)
MLTDAYILTTRYVDGTFFMFCLDRDSNPITLCIVEHHTYFYVKSGLSRDSGESAIKGEKINIKLHLSDIVMPKNIEVVKFFDAQYYSMSPTVHYKIHVKSYKDLEKAKSAIKKKGLAIAEHPSYESKLFSDLNMKPCQWIEFDMSKTAPIQICDFEVDRCREELAIKSSDIKSKHGCGLPPPRVLEMAFDCETYSARYGINGSLSMPNANLEPDELYCVSLVFAWSDSSKPHEKICICIHENSISTDDPSETIISVSNEEELFKMFFDYIRRYDPDVIYGHNSNSYDFSYISKRVPFMNLNGFGRLQSFEETIVLPGSENEYHIRLDLDDSEGFITHSWEGAGGTWHEYTIPVCYGRVILDTLTMLRNTKTSPGTPGELQSLSLKSLGQYFIGESKLDISYEETFLSYRSKDTGRIARVCSYCIQDSVLCMKIFHRTKCWLLVRESASIFFQDANNVTITGQTQKSYVNFLRTAERLGYAFHPINCKQDFKLKGGHVEVPVKGKHSNVITLDFASMYPTAQRAYNICLSTYSKLPPQGCSPSEYEKFEIPVEVGEQNLPACYEEYEGPNGDDIDPDLINNAEYIESVMKWNNFNPSYIMAFTNLVRRDHGLPVQDNLQTMIVYFVKQSKRRGILPTIQEELAESRAEYKSLMKKAEKEGNSVDKEMYDQRQQLVKVVMNSIYGCLGASVGRMSFPEGAATITYVGRTKIQEVREKLVELDCKIIYGDTDSLMFQVPRMINGVIGYDEDIPHLSAPVSDEVIERGKELTDIVNATMPKPMMMEFEKVINAIFIDKKRYMGYITWPKKTIFVRGAAAVRGDTTPFARQLYTSILSKILNDKTRHEVVNDLNAELEKLVEGHIPNEMLSVSKMLAHSYQSPSAPMKIYASYLESIGELAEPGTKIPLIVTVQSQPGPRSLSYRPPSTTEPIDYRYYAEMARRPLDKLIEAAYLNETE